MEKTRDTVLELILTVYRISPRTYLPHSTLDTLHDFCVASGAIDDLPKGYTELAFELVLPAVHRYRFGVNWKFVSWGNKTLETERRSWPGSQFKQASK